jgi:predicted nucleic acid-binding protein
MVTNESFLIADTSGLISLAVQSDRNHEAAVAATERLKEKQSNILVPYEILVETVNVLGKLVGHDNGSAVWVYLSTTPLFVIVDSSKQAREKAIKQFQSQPKAVSFTDCVVMAVADEYDTKAIFGFDSDHARNGYDVLKSDLAQAA